MMRVLGLQVWGTPTEPVSLQQSHIAHVQWIAVVISVFGT